jgi:hypothetical protein
MVNGLYTVNTDYSCLTRAQNIPPQMPPPLSSSQTEVEAKIIIFLTDNSSYFPYNTLCHVLLELQYLPNGLSNFVCRYWSRTDKNAFYIENPTILSLEQGFRRVAMVLH